MIVLIYILLQGNINGDHLCMARIWDETGAQRRIDIWDWKDALQKIGITLKDGAEEYIEQHCREEVSDAKVIQREKYNGTCLKEQFRLAGLGVAV